MPTLAEVAIEAHGCVACPLSRTRTNVVFGVGDESAELMLVGEAPGRAEDLQGEPFVGRSGKLLDRLLDEELGIDRSSCYIANVIKCRPPDNRDPLPLEVATCRHFLDSQVALIDPRVVITLGNFAMRALLQTKSGVSAMRGREHDFAGRVLVPTYHPAAALRSGGVVLAQMRADFVRAKRHLTS